MDIKYGGSVVAYALVAGIFIGMLLTLLPLPQLNLTVRNLDKTYPLGNPYLPMTATKLP
jgi:hypothetical protein